MFFNDNLLSKRNGPLAKVWLASHMGERKLSKAQLLGTSIPKSVGAIMGSDSMPMALRLSGQLLLGVARIYSRKAKYLVDDCNDALVKLKMTFRPGATTAVDMTADQAQASKAAITRQDHTNEFDALYQDVEMDFWNLEVYQSKATPGKSVAIANEADITRQDDDDDFEFQMPRIQFGDDLFGGRGGQDVELDVFGGEPRVGDKRVREDDEEDISVEIGRDAVHSADRLSNRMSSGFGAPNSDEQVFNDYGDGGGEGYGAELDFGPVNFGNQTLDTTGDFDLSQVLDAHDESQRLIEPNGDLEEGQRTPRATSPTAEANDQPEILADVDVTPRTAKRVADTADLNSAKKKRRAVAKPKVEKQIVDASTELVGSQGGRRALGSQSQANKATDPSLLVAPQYLPESRAAYRLFEIEKDVAAYYLPRILPNGKTYAGPPDLVPELAALFETSTTLTGPPTKKARKGAKNADADVSVELGRRDENGRLSDRFSLGADGLRFEDDWDPNTLIDRGDDRGGEYDVELNFDPVNMSQQAKSSTPAPGGSRAVTPLPIDLYATPIKRREPGEGMLGVFDVAPPTEQSQRTQAFEEERQAASHGWSKNTVRALRVLNDELGPAPIEGEEVDDKMLDFEKASEEASRPAAAAFFFELLVLGSKGLVDLKQKEAYGNISISAKPKMWQVVEKENIPASQDDRESTPIRTPVAGR